MTLLAHRARLAALAGAALTLWIAVGSPLGMLDHQLLVAHMVQHLLLMTVAAPLILLGFPRNAPPLHPVLCWLASTAIVIGWHVPALFELGMRWHRTEQASFLVAGLLFWSPIIEREPRWSVPLYLFLATLPCDALSAFLTFCGRVVYPHYLHADSPLRDQELAGALMWVWVTFAYLVPAVAVTIKLLGPGGAGPCPAKSDHPLNW